MVYILVRIVTNQGQMNSNTNSQLRTLVSTLDDMGSKPTLIDIAAALGSAGLSHADLAHYIQTSPSNYHRATVVLRDQYEMLVMTWLPGQSSVPHDHGGSVCAMLTVSGKAVEGSYSIAADGYVDLEYETVFRPGEVTAGQDAAVHTISNGGADTMVTVHIYTPPLRDFRRFTIRPSMTDHELPDRTDTHTIAVVGGGFAGSISAAQLIRQAKATNMPVRIVLLERRGSIGEGVAYSSREECHLLNVSAGRMSAWPDDPDDFLRWANVRYGPVSAYDFVPRAWYGEYVRQAVLKEAADAGDSVELSVVFDEARRITRHPSGGWMLNLARGTSVRAAAVLVAVGHRSPGDPLEKQWTGPRTLFISDPWKSNAIDAIGVNDSVVVLGTGLTAVDTVISLLNRGHRGQITLISRRGLLPQPHLTQGSPAIDLTEFVADLTAETSGIHTLDLCRKLRRRVSLAAKDGVPWQSVVDGLRPHISRLWSKMPTSEKRRFLSHVRSFWEVHRHRMPPRVAERFSASVESGGVRVLAGRVESVNVEDERLHLIIRGRRAGTKTSMVSGWIINATGPTPSNSASANPAIGSLLVQGLLTVDPLNIGVRTTPDGRAIGVDEEASDDIVVVGTLRKPDLWESTAVPELRGQAADAAGAILKHSARPSSCRLEARAIDGGG